MYVWNSSAIPPFPVRVPGRHKGIIRLDGLRGKNSVPWVKTGMSSLNTPHVTGHFILILHLLLNHHLEDKIFLSLVQKEGNRNF